MKQRNFLRRLFSVLVMIAFSSLSYAYNFFINGIYYNDESLYGRGEASVTSKYISGSYNDLDTYSGVVRIPSIINTPNNGDRKIASIGEYAFYNSPNLQYVEFPNTITKIGDYAFFRCTKLGDYPQEIELPNNLTEIGERAFWGCRSLTSSITFPVSLERIGIVAFNQAGLTSITFLNKRFAEDFSDITTGNSIENEGSGQQWDCSNSVNIASVSNAFKAGGAVRLGTGSKNGSLTTVPLNVTKGSNVVVEIDVKGWTTVEGKLLIDLTGCEQQSITYTAKMSDNFETVVAEFKDIPESDPALTISTSSKRCFIDAIRVNRADGSEAKELSIGDWAFSGCSSLTSVSISDLVASIGNRVFISCPSLASISVAAGNTTYDSRNNCNAIIEKSTNTLIVGCMNTVIPEDVTNIGEAAFLGCSSLTSISIPASVTSIGESAFSDCSSLTSIISLLDPTSTSLGSNVFDGVDKTIPLYVPASLVDKYRSADQWKDFTNILPIEGSSITASVGSDGLATYCPPVGVDFSEAEKIAAYRAAVEGSTVTLTKADKVNAGEGVLLRSLNGGAAEENLPLSIYPVNAENAFVGVSNQTTIYETDGDATNFVLSNVGGVVGFYKAKPENEKGTSVAAGKAYLPVKDYDPSVAIKGLTLVFEDGLATGIDIVDSVQEQASDDDTYYTIGGVPVKNPTQKGVYIKGGKKYIIK